MCICEPCDYQSVGQTRKYLRNLDSNFKSWLTNNLIFQCNPVCSSGHKKEDIITGWLYFRGSRMVGFDNIMIFGLCAKYGTLLFCEGWHLQRTVKWKWRGVPTAAASLWSPPTTYILPSVADHLSSKCRSLCITAAMEAGATAEGNNNSLFTEYLLMLRCR